jgi:hypothetical protein
MNWWTFLVIAIVLVLLPPKYDPAIRLKEWQERNKHPDEDKQ